MNHLQFFITVRGKDCRGEPIRGSMNFVKSKMETGKLRKTTNILEYRFSVRGPT
jgi:hypothetical protein